MSTFNGRVLLLLLLLISVMGFAQDFQQPVLISSAGQSADVKLVKLLASRENLDAVTTPLATADDLEGVKTLLLVPGFSSKGLGAAGISQQEEMDRVQALVKAAGVAKIPIILVHVGGNARRKGQSDAFNELVARNSRHMIVVSQGDEDQFFSGIASEENIPLNLVENISAASVPLGKLFK
jgi:hypothetical protein